MQQRQSEGGSVQFPVDNATYNLLVTLVEKLQALESYEKYSRDASQDELTLYRQLIDEDTLHAEHVYEVLRKRLSG